MARTVLLACLGGGLMLLSGLQIGCAKADVTIPQVRWGEPAPSGSIARANSSDKAGLVRENQELRARVDWLRSDNSGKDQKYQKRGAEIERLHDEIDDVRAQRDRYRRDAGM